MSWTIFFDLFYFSYPLEEVRPRKISCPAALSLRKGQAVRVVARPLLRRIWHDLDLDRMRLFMGPARDDRHGGQAATAGRPVH
jgi:hypothetical protein